MNEGQMSAAVMHGHGGPDVVNIERVPRPRPGSDEVVVRVGACAISHLDVFVRNGMPGVTIPMPHIPGGDVAGWIAETGEGVRNCRQGDPVLVDPTVAHGTLGEAVDGGLAEYVMVPAGNVIPLTSDTIGLFIRCAALPIAYGTAYRMLFDRGAVKRGETIVVSGASGGVGVSCVQLAKQAGAQVIAITSSADKARRLGAIGAHKTIVAKDGQFSKQVWDATGKVGADVVVDFTGKVTWPQSLRCVKRGGRLLTCGATTGHEALTDLRYVWVREIDIRGSDAWTRDGLSELVRLTESGELKPVIHAVTSLTRFADAFAELEGRRAFGKVVVLPDDVYHEYEKSAAGR